jgi:hypothetical protein
MGTKLNPGVYDCYNAAESDEPNFTLLARDPNAGRFVRMWATARLAQIEDGVKPRSDLAKVEAARQCADAMDKWFVKNRT